MYTGIRLHDTAGADLRGRLANARAQGFTCAHLAMQKLLPGFKMNDAPELLTEELAAEVRAALEDTGMSCALLGCYLNLATPDEAAYAHTLEIYRAHIRFAAMIGARATGTETGAPNTGYKTEPACFTDESLQLFIDRVAPVVRYAEEQGQAFAIEPVCRHIVNTPARAEKVLKAFESPNLHIILDPVNLLNMANCADRDAIIADAITRLGDRVILLHMKDFVPVPGAADVDSVGCGQGGMDYTALIRYAIAHPEIPMTLENTRPDNAEQCRLVLEGYRERLCK